jgi:hypothetical protein
MKRKPNPPGELVGGGPQRATEAEARLDGHHQEVDEVRQRAIDPIDAHTCPATDTPAWREERHRGKLRFDPFAMLGGRAMP